MTSKPSTTNRPKLSFQRSRIYLKLSLTFEIALRKENKVHYKGSCHSTIHTVCSRDISGGYSDGVPPLPIPNREVKPDRADGTAHPRESRSPPFYKTSLETRKRLGALLCLDGWGASAMREEWSVFGTKDSADAEEDISVCVARVKRGF